MTVKERLDKKRTRLEHVETLIEEQEGYSSLKAQGMFGAETKFTDVDKLYKERDKLDREIAYLELQLA